MLQFHSLPMDAQQTSRPAEQPDFAEVLAAAQAGDKPAQDELFRRFYPDVERIVHVKLSRDLRLGRPWLTARFSTGDVVQEVFRGLLTDLSGFQGDTERAFVGYLAMMARNRLIDAIRFHEASRRDGRATLPEGDHVPGSEEHGPATQVASHEEAELFQELLEDFPEREQLLLRARTEQEAQFQELAEQLGYSSAWAARRAFYAAQAKLAIRLRQRMSD